MKIALLTPPLGCITHPYLSLPTLTAFLRSIGHDVFQCDIGMRAIDEMFSPAYLQSLHESILEKIEQPASPGEITQKREEHLRRLMIADLFATDVIENIERAKSILRSKDQFYRAEKYLYASNVIRRAFDIVSAAHFPTEVSFDHVAYGQNMTLENIYAITSDEARNPFLKIMRQVVLPQVLGEIPPVVGISVTFYPQFFSGYTLARLIKSTSPATHIVMGGSAVTSAEERLRAQPRSFDWVDSYVFGEGESALAKLLEIVESGFSIRNNLNKLYLKPDRDSDQGESIAIDNRPERENFNELPGPDYSGLNLGDYFSPETVFLISSGRGCYYGKCAFCSVSLAFKNECRQRSVEVLLGDIRSLQEKHGARFFYFADDCISPKRYREISEMAPRLELPFYWQGEIRFEKAFSKDALQKMHRGGCRMLIFGNESGNQRVLDLMRKNTDVETNSEIIRNACEAGIAVHLQNFLGFPGETTDEAKDTIDFLVSIRDHITSFALDIFRITEYSPVHLNPRDFGITRILPRNDSELIPHFIFSTRSGATREEVQQVFEAAKERLSRAYPNQHHFLDGHIGTHVLLYLTFCGETKRERIFPDLPKIDKMIEKRPRLKASVKSRQIGKGDAVMYNPETGRIALLDKMRAKWPDLADGSMSLKESCARLHGAVSKEGKGGTLQNIIALVTFMANDLYLAGFLDFD